MDCKLFQMDHNDISCGNFDIVSSSEICNGSMVSIITSTSSDQGYFQPYPDWQSVRIGMKLTRYARFEELDEILPLLQARDINLEILGWAFPNSKIAFYDQELDLHNGRVMSWAGRDQLGGVRTGSSDVISVVSDSSSVNRLNHNQTKSRLRSRHSVSFILCRVK